MPSSAEIDTEGCRTAPARTSSKNSSTSIPRRYQLVTDENARAYSLYSLQFIVACSAINTKMLNPNFPILCTPDASPDSFPSTAPFEFNSATYFLPMTTLLGVAIASLFMGKYSDRVGRKKVLLMLANVSCVGSIVKYSTRNNFWGFCASNFIFGFFLGNLPVAMAYVGDVYTDRLEKVRKLSAVVACFVMGNSGGGIIAISMQSSGLFAPLWVGSVLMLVSSLCVSWYLIEPRDMRLVHMGDMAKRHVDEEDEKNRPVTIDPVALWNVIFGALADNIGSTGLFPLCLSPLAIEQYLFEFTERGEEPIMSITGYKWLSVMVALMVIPATLMTPFVFKKIGVAGTWYVRLNQGKTVHAIATVRHAMIQAWTLVHGERQGDIIVSILTRFFS